jgi:Uma2 family endonuclease
MAVTSTLLSIEEYLRTSYHPDVDYIHGEIQERNLGEFEHATFQSAIAAWFWIRRSEWGIHPVIEQRMQVSSDRVRICDVGVLRADAPRERVTTTPPLICIEILSPEDRLSRAKQVLTDYLQMGVQNVWLIDPIYRSAWTFDAAGLHEADPANLFVRDTPIRLDLTEAFAAID